MRCSHLRALSFALVVLLLHATLPAAGHLLTTGQPTSRFTVEVGWGAKPLAKTPALNSWHDVSGGASGNPKHDDVYPPTQYDIVDAINARRRELPVPFVRLWWDASVEFDFNFSHPFSNFSGGNTTATAGRPPLRANPEQCCGGTTRAQPGCEPRRCTWDFRAMDVKVLNFMKSVVWPETTILQVTGNSLPAWWVRPGAANSSLRDPSGVTLGKYLARVLDWYQKGGFTDEDGVYHHSGHNLTFGYIEILNEWDANAHLAHPDWTSEPGILANIRRYISIYDGATRVIRRHHPRIKFLGACSGGVHPEHNSIYWRTFLNQSEHAPGTPVGNIDSSIF